MAYNLQLVATHKQESISTVKNLIIRNEVSRLGYYLLLY